MTTTAQGIRPHIVSLSGGTASAVAADRVINRFGKNQVTLWFADTLWEDEDLYRFLDDCSERWGLPITVSTEGRTPLQVAEDRKIIPNQRRAPCSLVLKQLQFKTFLASAMKPAWVHLGLDWTEEHRMARPKSEYEQMEGVTVDFPLTWPPLPTLKYYATVQAWGIKPPRLYDLGFPHNNCGGRCVRQGVKEWLRLKATFPERFAEVRDWEQAQRAKGGARATFAIARDRKGGDVKPLTLAEIEQIKDDDPQMDLFQGDAFGCFCEY
jgi:3'-phosphoadenosine 5'-phosphosulfate sulfotransferase (PAPS reductase)/FAD synthetase